MRISKQLHVQIKQERLYTMNLTMNVFFLLFCYSPYNYPTKEFVHESTIRVVLCTAVRIIYIFVTGLSTRLLRRNYRRRITHFPPPPHRFDWAYPVRAGVRVGSPAPRQFLFQCWSETWWRDLTCMRRWTCQQYWWTSFLGMLKKKNRERQKKLFTLHVILG